MKRIWNQFRALALLGIQALILQPLRRLRNIGKSGASRFLSSYTPERLLPMTEDEHSLRTGDKNGSIHPSGGSCILCGLCDTSCPVSSDSKNRTILSSHLIAYSRTMPDYVFMEDFPEESGICNDCGICEEICPANVPIRMILTDIRNHRKRLENIEISAAGSESGSGTGSGTGAGTGSAAVSESGAGTGPGTESGEGTGTESGAENKEILESTGEKGPENTDERQERHLE